MNIAENTAGSVRDTRVTEYLYPTRIIATRGSVTNAEALLSVKRAQISLSEHEYTVLESDSHENASVLLDFGRELHGGIRLMAAMLNGLSCALFRISFGESAAEACSQLGEKGSCNDHSPRDFTLTLPMLSDITAGQTGFRFVLIELLTPGVRFPLYSAQAVFSYTDIARSGSFVCSDPLLNDIYETAVRTCHLCIQNMIWDGIKRDRLVWCGDIHPEMLTVRSVFGAIPQMDVSLRFSRDITPLPEWMCGMPSYSMWWIVTVRDWYMATGNADIICESRDYIAGLAGQLADCVCEGELVLPGYFLDWPTCDSSDGSRGSASAAKVGVCALAAIALDSCAELLKISEYDGSLCTLCAEKAASLRAANLPDCDSPQAAAMQALAGAIPFDDAAELLVKGGADAMSSFMGFYILTAASRAGKTREALDAARGYYGAMLSLGATTFWEAFEREWADGALPIDTVPAAGAYDVHGDNGAYCYKGYRNSFCHGWASGVAAFLAESVLGITVEEAGCRRISVCPSLGDLEWAHGTYPTPFGVVSVDVRRDGGNEPRVSVKAPPEVTVRLCLSVGGSAAD